MFRSCQIIIGELYSLLKLYYGIHNSILICKWGVAAYHVVLWSSGWVCVVRCTPSHCSTTHSQQHDMLPQHLVCKYDLNCEYNFSKEQSSLMIWQDRNMSECLKCFKMFWMCFMWNYMCIRWLINWSDSTKMHGATIRFILVTSFIFCIHVK